MTHAPSRREFDIDFFRGWVCLNLMVLHFYNSALYDAYKRLFGTWGEYAIWNLRLGVESFFILAGFMMAHMLRPQPGERVSTARYLQRRFYRLILPYWTAVLIFAAYRWLARLVLHADAAPSATDVLAQMFLVQEFVIAPDGLNKVVPDGYWSMVSLEQFYVTWVLLYAVCLKALGRQRGAGNGRAERVMSFLTFVCCLISLMMWIQPDFRLPGTSLGWRVEDRSFSFVWGENGQRNVELPLYLVFLTYGLLLYWAIRQRSFSPYFAAACLALLIGAFATNISYLWKALVTTLIFLPLARGARLPEIGVLRFLRYCGQRSYSMYLIHPIAGVAFISLTWKLTNKSHWLAVPLTLGAIVVSIGASLLFFKFVEQPCQRKSRTIDYRRPRTPPLAVQDGSAAEAVVTPLA
jgi:peptidoglycan/LPS O-acetylase OafA/YrhL